MTTKTAAVTCDSEEQKTKTPSKLKKEALKAEKKLKFLQKEEKKQHKVTLKSTKDSNDDPVQKESIIYAINHKLGEKKDTSIDLPKAYSPSYVEAAWYEWWEKEGFFRPDFNFNFKEINPKGCFTIIIPPPNVTGMLHLGHALASTVEDTLCRWHRMRGETVLYNPGCDHAGIATQVVVEKKLMRERGLTRFDLGRQKFVDEIWKWKKEKGIVIYDQLRKLGTGVDWDRACFMMDPKIVRAVTAAFIKLHEDGVIYRSNRLVNWSCALRSAISDIEVDKMELTGRTALSVPGYSKKIDFGVLVCFAYPVENSDEKVVVATTRPETMLGDVAVAVHPLDERYKHLIGKFCKHPFLDRRLPIFADDFVDQEFGTGAVKITPAHDINDYEVGKRHNLPFVTCMTEDGIMNDTCAEFKGLKRFDARHSIVAALKGLNLFVEEIENPMVVPICSRSKDVVEPILKPQWYVKCDVMAERAMAVVRNGDLKIIPDFHVAAWNRWLEGIKDWCISRQLWWGIRIPAYFVTISDVKVNLEDMNENEYWVSATTEEEAIGKAARRFGVDRVKVSVKWDEDVLDTWFSSAIWPFSIFGWPEKTIDLERFFPSSVLETGHDILFFWVARMVFLSQQLTGKLPFKEIYLHAMIRDAHGRKMSKSLGNVIDPIDVIHGISLPELNKKLESGNLDPRELTKAKAGQLRDYPNGIPECGSDALRFALMNYTSQSRNINLDVLRIQGYRFFCNKIWQAARFSLLQFADTFKPLDPFKIPESSSLLDRWILSRLSATIEACNIGLSTFNFHHATAALYRFWLYEFCDIYIESSKPVLSKETSEGCLTAKYVIYECMDAAFRLLAPFMPFITEELWQRFVRRGSDCHLKSLCFSPYPIKEEYLYRDEELEDRINAVMDTVRKVRSLRSDYDLTSKTKTDLYIITVKKSDVESLQEFAPLITTFTSSRNVSFLTTDDMRHCVPKGCAQAIVSSSCKIALLLEGIVDIGKELDKLNAKRSKLNEQLIKLQEHISVENYSTKVPLGVQRNNTERIGTLTSEIFHIDEAIRALEDCN